MYLVYIFYLVNPTGKTKQELYRTKKSFKNFDRYFSESPDKECKENHDDDLEEDDGKDVTAGPHGLHPLTRHVSSNSLG